MKKLLSLALFLTLPLLGEIQSLTIIWNPLLCNPKCASELVNRLQKTNGVDKVAVSQQSGRAEIVWKKDVPFSFQPINWAVRYVGMRPDLIHIKVRGKIVASGRNFNLISEGDRTPFVLRGPIVPNMNQYAEQYNPESHPISLDLSSKLQEIAKNNQMAVVDGIFFEPYRAPPNQIVISSINAEDNKKR